VWFYSERSHFWIHLHLLSRGHSISNCCTMVLPLINSTKKAQNTRRQMMVAHQEAPVLSAQVQHLQERTVMSAYLLQAPVLSPDAARAPCFESLFDPVELLGKSIPFVDPFSYDDCEFHASEFFISERPQAQTLSSRPIRASPHYPALLSQDLQYTAVLERETSPVLQRTPSFPPAGPGASQRCRLDLGHAQ